MFQISSLYFYFVVGLDIIAMAILAITYRRYNKNTLSRPALTALFVSQLTVIIYFLGVPLDGIRLDLEKTNIKSVFIYSLGDKGANLSTRVSGRLKPFVGGSSTYLSLPTIEKGNYKYEIKFGDKPADFSLKEIHLYASLPWGKKQISIIQGDALHGMLYAPNPGINISYLDKNTLKSTPTHQSEPSWLEFPIGIKANHTLWRSSDKVSLLFTAVFWSIFIAIVAFTVKYITAQAIAHARGIVTTKASQISYYLVNTSSMIIAIALILILAEYCLRYYYKDVLSAPTSITYFYKKHYPKFLAENNALGYRGKYFSIAKDDRLRIVVMGDSFAWGQGVYPYTKRFPEQLEILLNKRPGQKVEVLNLGTAGFDLPNYTKYLPFILPLNPDFILYQWYTNDMNVIPGRSFRLHKPILPNKSIHQYLHQNSILYYLLENAAVKIKALTGTGASYLAYMEDNYKTEGSMGREKSKSVLQKLMKQLKNSGVPFGIVLFPDTISLANIDQYQFGFLHDIVLDECRKMAIPCLDLRSAYSVFDDRMKDTWVNVFDAHPSEEVHRLAAQKIQEYFGPTWESMMTDK